MSKTDRIQTFAGMSNRATRGEIYQRILSTYLARLSNGKLAIELPNGETMHFHGTAPGPSARLSVRNLNFFRRCALGGDTGFGESWMAREWDTDDLPQVLRYFTANMDGPEIGSFWTSLGLRTLDRVRHSFKRNSRRGSRENISAHYDLSNEFFALFLDETMTYSSAWFSTPNESLESAQRGKIRRLLQKLELRSDHTLLEIGSGWGELSLMAVKEFGCRVKTITLSQEQHRQVIQKAAHHGMQDRIDAEIRDYRDIEGRYDRIVSVEMIEAVGHEYLPEFFGCMDKALRKDGIAAMQVITMPEERYDNYRRNPDWIQKYIFPGAVCPSLFALQEAMKKRSRLMIENLENIGPHYARTLGMWRSRFMQRREEVMSLGFDDRFCRMWEYYLAYCEVGFEQRVINTLQLVLSRQHNTTLVGGIP